MNEKEKPARPPDQATTPIGPNRALPTGDGRTTPINLPALKSDTANPATHDSPAGLGELESLVQPQGGEVFLAHFRLIEEVGRGGMGTVYRAVDTLLDRQVAVKVLSEDLNQAQTFQERFIREAKIIARMNHPNIPQIHFIGRAEERLFFAMEWIEGRTIEALSAEGPLPPIRALDIAMQAAEALRVAHQAGIVHRDIKPSNLMLTREGLVKVLDFGIARSAAIQGDATATSGFVGTAHYASPEQARGASVDARSDIYSLGATLYHLLAGRPPFEGDNALAVLTDRLIKEAPALPPGADMTPGIRALVARMLAMRPEQRFPDTESLLEAIRIVSPVPPIPARRAKRLMAFLTDLLLLNVPLVALFVGFWAIKGYFITTRVYDSLAGRFLLGTILMLWFLAYFVLLGHRGEATFGQRLQGIWVAASGHKTAPLARVVVRVAVWWAPVCLAMVLQPDWPIVLRSTTGGVEEDAGLTNLPWLLSLLWLIALGLLVLLSPKGRTIADWASRTEVVERPHREPKAEQRMRMALPLRARAKVALLRPRSLLNSAVLAAWLAVAIAVGSEIRGGTANGWSPSTIQGRHTMFEKIEPGDPGWERLRTRFLHEFLRKGDSAVNPEVLSFERHPLLPYVSAQMREPLIVENTWYGARVEFHLGWVWALSGSHTFGGASGIRADELPPTDEKQEREWGEARREIYRNSREHFLRALMHQRVKEEGFDVLNKDAFVGLFRKDDVFILVAWPSLKIRVPNGQEKTLTFWNGSAFVGPQGQFFGSVGYWGNEVLPQSVLAAYAEEQDRAWGKSTASIEQVLALDDAPRP